MRKLLSKLHAKLGDLWWYSLMIFVACRSGDVIQAFIGLWLVPKYVGPNELGAVLPLQQLSGLFAVPLAIMATVFSKYVNTYATRGELGKVKSFIHDVLLAAILVFIVCIAVAYLVIPHFYVRLNVVSGMLTVLILASGFVGNIGSLLGAAQQGLKQFRMMSLQTLISAPIRLITLLVAMPIRALSGYILGQTTPSACTSALAAFSLHKDLRAIPSDTTWRRDLPEIWHYLWPIAIYTIFGTLLGTIQSTIYRQRLPEIESAANYMLTRFTEIGSYLAASLTIVMVPLISEAHEKNTAPNKFLWQALVGTVVCTGFTAILLNFVSTSLLNLTETWRIYIHFAELMPWMAINTGLSALVGLLLSSEFARRRFRIPFFFLTCNFAWTSFIVCFTGCDFFHGMLSDATINFMRNCHINTLANLTYSSVGINLIQLVVSLFCMICINKNQDQKKTRV